MTDEINGQLRIAGRDEEGEEDFIRMVSLSAQKALLFFHPWMGIFLWRTANYFRPHASLIS